MFVIQHSDAVKDKIIFTFQMCLSLNLPARVSVMFPEGISFHWQLCLLPTSHFLVNPDAVVNLHASFSPRCQWRLMKSGRKEKQQSN